MSKKGNEETARFRRASKAAVTKSRGNIRRKVKTICPGDPEFEGLAAQCTPVSEIADHHGNSAYAFCVKNMRRATNETL